MRRSKLLFSSILATVLGMGVIGGVLTTKNTESKSVEMVEAAAKPTTVKTIGLRLSGSYWGSAAAYYSCQIWNSSTSKGDTYHYNFESGGQVSTGEKVIYCDVSDFVSSKGAFTHIVIHRWGGPGRTSWWNKWAYYSDGNGGEGNHSFSANSSNYFENNGWDSCDKKDKDYDPGYYLFGNMGGSWGIATAIAPDATPVSGNQASWSSVTFAANNECKIGYYNMGGGIDYQNNGFAGQHYGFSWSTSYAENNIKCTTAGTYKVFLNNAWETAINKDITIACYERRKDTTTSKGNATCNTDILLSSSLSGMFGTYTGYTIKEYRSGSTTGSVVNINNTYPTTESSIYAIYQAATYTLTFYPNGGTGSQTTRTKTHDIAFPIPTPQSLNINAGPARVALSWNTKEDGSGDTYKIDGTSTYTTDKAESFYLQQGFKSYEYSVDGGSTWVQMPKIATATDCVATYASDPSNYLPAGQIVTIRSYYDGVQAHTIQATDTWTGNTYPYGGQHYISIGTHNRIVLYVTNGGQYNVDVWGGSERGIAINRSGFETKYECELNETTHNYTGTITVLPGDIIEAFYNYATTYSITMTNYSAYGIAENGRVSVPAVYQMTLTWDGTDGGYPTINVDSMIAVDTATLIAQTFNSDMTPLCTAVEGGSAPSTLVTQWGVEAGYYAKLTSATQNILNGTTSTSDTDVRAMQAKYDRIVGKYNRSISSINDYMGRNPAPIGNSLGVSLFGSLSNNDSNVLFAIIIVSVLSVASVGGYFLIRRKKQK